MYHSAHQTYYDSYGKKSPKQLHSTKLTTTQRNSTHARAHAHKIRRVLNILTCNCHGPLLTNTTFAATNATKTNTRHIGPRKFLANNLNRVENVVFKTICHDLPQPIKIQKTIFEPMEMQDCLDCSLLLDSRCETTWSRLSRSKS